MEFEVQAREDGEFQVVQLQPVVVARCPDQAMAITIASMLNGQSERVEAPKLIGQEKPVKAEPEAVGEPSVQARSEPQRLEGEDLEAAFAAIRAGEKVSDVAERMGTTMPILRGQWSGQARRERSEQPEAKTSTALVPVEKAPQTALGKVTTAIQELQDAPNCRLCGRTFVMTPDRQDLCARCSADDL
jgi:transposase-like protein